MEKEFEKIYEWTKERITREKESLNEFKKDVRQSEALLIGIIIICIIISFIAEATMAKYIFITVATMMFVFCSFYAFKYERQIIDKQNKFSEIALSEFATHVKDGFTYEENEEISGTYYIKSGFNRQYKELKSKGIISGTRGNHSISLSNIIVRSETKELFKGIFVYGTLNKDIKEIDLMRVNSKNNKKEKYAIDGEDLYMYAEKIEVARKILTDELINDIINFEKKIKLNLELMMNKKYIFFRFFDNEIITEPITNEKQTKEYLFKYYSIIEFISNFIEKIEAKEE